MPNDAFFENVISSFQAYEQEYLQKLAFPDDLLLDAVKYVLASPGKRFRAMLVYAAGYMFNIAADNLHSLAMSIEMIHAYSLVHDDLPAMDNDDYRRGRLSCHKKFDDATAILTGNTLNHLAFSLLINTLPSKQAMPIMKLILHFIGPYGILSGQSMDLKILSQKDFDIRTLQKIHYLKTTTLFEAVLMSVAVLANADISTKQQLTQFTKHLGLAYQMLDDYGDYYATEHWGKKKSSDAINAKYTYVNFYSQTELKKNIQQEITQAVYSISGLDKVNYLIHLINQLKNRLDNL